MIREKPREEGNLGRDEGGNKDGAVDKAVGEGHQGERLGTVGGKEGSTKTGLTRESEQVRYLRGLPKETTMECIAAALQEGGMGYEEYLVMQTVPQAEFKGARKFVEIRVANQEVADKLAQAVKVIGKKYPWKLRRFPPQLGHARVGGWSDAHRPHMDNWPPLLPQGPCPYLNPQPMHPAQPFLGARFPPIKPPYRPPLLPTPHVRGPYYQPRLPPFQATICHRNTFSTR